LLTGCNVTDDNATRNNNNDGVQPTRFENTGTGDRMNDNNNRNNTDNNRNRNQANNEQRFNDNNTNGNNQNRYDVAEEAAEQIANKIPEIKTAYVLTTENNAYVAARLDAGNESDRNRDNARNTKNNNNKDNNNNNNNDEELTEDMKERIADIVRSVDNDIENVFVSTNPDFYNLTTNYVDDVDGGRPIEGFFTQFENMIERLFPQNR